MELVDDIPHVRVTLGSDNITITGDVNLVDTVTVNSTPADPVHTHITEVGTSGLLAVPYMPIQGTVTVNQPVAVTDNNGSLTVDGTVSLSANTLAALEDINATVTGSVLVSNFPATQAVTGTFWQTTQPVSIATMPTTPVTIATMPTTPVTGTFWQATQPVSGTVTVQDGGGTITVDGTVTANVTFPTTQQVSGTVALDTASLTALENIGVTGTVTVQDGGGSITVDGSVSATVSGTVELGTTTLAALENINANVSGTVSIGTDGTVSLSATTLSALENTTVTISGTPTVNIGTIPEVEIKNDTGNPIPISKNTTVNSSANPIFVSADLVGSGERSGSLSNIDSKGRLKVQTQQTIFFNTFQYGKETDVWDEATYTGGSAVLDAGYSNVRMDVTNAVGSRVIRQTRNTQRYTPGRQQSIAFAMRFQAPVVGVRRRIGMFNSTPDGFFFEDCGTRDAVTNLPQYACVVVNSGGATPTTERIYRADWNGDRLDGTGVSGITIDFAKQQLYMIDYEWYGAGSITFSVVINGLPRVIHTVQNGNRLYSPWCKTPFLPIRVEIENFGGTAGTHSLWQGSNSLLTEGTVEKLGIAESILTPLTGINMSSANTFYPIISIRLKATALQGIVLPSFFQAGTVDNTDIYFKLIRNATVNGTWVDHPDSNAFTQYNYTSTGAITDGFELTSGLLTAGGASGPIALDQATVYQIGRSSLGTVSDTLTLAIAAKNANKNAVANLTWIEQR
jgi:hypothetical protein